MMDELMELLKARPTMYLATVEGYCPRVRPVNHYMIYKGYFYLALCKDKEAYKQLLDNTNLELTAALGENDWIRIRGTVNFDTSAEAYAAAFAEMPDLEESFSEDTGKRLALIYLDHISAMTFDREDNAQLLAKF